MASPVAACTTMPAYCVMHVPGCKAYCNAAVQKKFHWPGLLLNGPIRSPVVKGPSHTSTWATACTQPTRMFQPADGHRSGAQRGSFSAMFGTFTAAATSFESHPFRSQVSYIWVHPKRNIPGFANNPSPQINASKSDFRFIFPES